MSQGAASSAEKGRVMRRTRGRMRRRKDYSVSHTSGEQCGEQKGSKYLPGRTGQEGQITLLAPTSSHVQLLPYEQGSVEERA
jgi:hypothetical protein